MLEQLLTGVMEDKRSHDSEWDELKKQNPHYATVSTGTDTPTSGLVLFFSTNTKKEGFFKKLPQMIKEGAIVIEDVKTREEVRKGRPPLTLYLNASLITCISSQ